MQVTEKYSDRRHNKRRHVNRRINARSGNPRRSNPRRSDARRKNARLNHYYEVSVLDYDGKTVNVSARGVYFEVITSDVEVFTLGTSIPLQMNEVTDISEGLQRTLRFSGRGTVVRNCIIENSDHDNCLGVALEFTEKLILNKTEINCSGY